MSLGILVIHENSKKIFYFLRSLIKTYQNIIFNLKISWKIINSKLGYFALFHKKNKIIKLIEAYLRKGPHSKLNIRTNIIGKKKFLSNTTDYFELAKHDSVFSLSLKKNNLFLIKERNLVKNFNIFFFSLKKKSNNVMIARFHTFSQIKFFKQSLNEEITEFGKIRVFYEEKKSKNFIKNHVEDTITLHCQKIKKKNYDYGKVFVIFSSEKRLYFTFNRCIDILAELFLFNEIRSFSKNKSGNFIIKSKKLTAIVVQIAFTNTEFNI